MTATVTMPAMMTIHWPRGLLSIQAWEAWDDPAFRHAELVEGVVQMSPAPMLRHQVVLHELVSALGRAGRPHGMGAVGDADVVLARGFPPTVRQPDVTVTTRDVLLAGPKNLDPSDVVLAVEIVSPGSARTDRIAKLADYADAGIPHYWIIDVQPSSGAAPAGGSVTVTLDVHLLDDKTYRRTAHAEGGTVELADPFPITLDLDALVTGCW